MTYYAVVRAEIGLKSYHNNKIFDLISYACTYSEKETTFTYTKSLAHKFNLDKARELVERWNKYREDWLFWAEEIT